MSDVIYLWTVQGDADEIASFGRSLKTMLERETGPLHMVVNPQVTLQVASRTADSAGMDGGDLVADGTYGGTPWELRAYDRERRREQEARPVPNLQPEEDTDSPGG